MAAAVEEAWAEEEEQVAINLSKVVRTVALLTSKEATVQPLVTVMWIQLLVIPRE
jgi:hypothetical protein